ncbi:TetR/AcrR family transcriptional regulator C-terminal domain-containing protein [Falsarthrobacter nasiphocae]|uniref:AcrR family transcriptional regulator n=1 Tax=Falsarthrobacter nasiphocae TaxID=189863 RepID=A0AAE3YH74_9MICC|nr:TetR/AcrR family transcriptional regulator C-terminal domain-containing protein [Falsarthrobacter nasiphocae]MDR6891868.1 AcrR family transcriptional regulator [Falsarthrobacter nasiphocae]
MALSRNEITNAALRILRKYGFADLSMRRIAADLEVQPSALYWHVHNKQELLVLTATAILEHCRGEDLPQLARSIRAALSSVRDGADVALIAVAASPEPLPGLAQIPPLLRGFGLSDQDAEWGAKTLEHHILAAVAAEQNAEALGRDVDPLAPEAFDFGVRAILKGLGAERGVVDEPVLF